MKKSMIIRKAKQNEIWKAHPIHKEYLISTLGRIKRAVDGRSSTTKYGVVKRPNVKAGIFIKGQRQKTGYVTTLLTILKDVKKPKLIHRLVLETFVGPCPKGKEANHKNGIKWDNYLSNLEWITRSENAKHAYRTGLQPPNEARNTRPGELASLSKLKEGEVWLIKRILRQKEKNPQLIKLCQIGKMFKVNYVTIYAIRVGKTWKHVP